MIAIRRPVPMLFGMAALLAASAAGATTPAPSPARTDTSALARQMQVGDIVFIHVDILPFRKIAHDTESWTNHVGIVIDISGKEPLIAESTFPLSKTTPLSQFVARSKEGRVSVQRLNQPLSAQQQDSIREEALARLHTRYDTGFNLHSHGQFCSRYVHEVVDSATGIPIGSTETLATLFAENPNADLAFWRIWYFGKIPWNRETITPASLLESPALHTVFDGYARNGRNS